MSVRRPGLVRRLAFGAKNMWAVATGGTLAVPPWDDYWYRSYSVDSAAGMAVTPESAMRLSAVFSCIRVRSETLASLPLIIYRRLPNGGKERAIGHPLYRLLHDSPNQWQTAMDFFEMGQAHLDLRGNSFSRIVSAPGSPIDQIIPLHPDFVDVFRLPDGRLKYRVRSAFTAEVDWYMADEMLHVRGLSADGFVGLSPIAVQRETMGSGLAMQDHGARFFANGATPSIVLKHPGHFKDDAARAKFKQSIQESQTKSHKHSALVIEDGMDARSLGLSNKDSQFLEATQASREEICGIYRVPPHKAGILNRATNNNIEQQAIEFVTDCMRPIVIRWEQRINQHLVDPISEGMGAEPGEYFAEFLLDGLLRGDLLSRYQAYSIAIQWGWFCPNDVCDRENMNPIPDEKGGNEYLRPLNMVARGAVTVGQPGAPANTEDETDKTAPPANRQDTPPPDRQDDTSEESPDEEKKEENARRDALVKLYASQAAGRVVRRETAALRRMLAKSPDAFEDQARGFYSEHAGIVAEAMCIPRSAAAKYARQNLRLISSIPAEERSSALDWIEDTATASLAELAIGSRKNGSAPQHERCVQ